MSIDPKKLEEVIVQARLAMKKRTQEERRAFLQKANILNAKGEYKSKYFSKETVEKSKVQNSESKISA